VWRLDEGGPIHCDDHEAVGDKAGTRGYRDKGIRMSSGSPMKEAATELCRRWIFCSCLACRVHARGGLSSMQSVCHTEHAGDGGAGAGAAGASGAVLVVVVLLVLLLLVPLLLVPLLLVLHGLSCHAFLCNESYQKTLPTRPHQVLPKGTLPSGG